MGVECPEGGLGAPGTCSPSFSPVPLHDWARVTSVGVGGGSGVWRRAGCGGMWRDGGGGKETDDVAVLEPALLDLAICGPRGRRW